MADKIKEENVHRATVDMDFVIRPLTMDVSYLNMLIYGKFGSGKTTLAATAADVPEMCDVLMLDIESGKMAIQDNDRITNKGAIDTVRITNFKQLAKVHKFLSAHCRLRDQGDDVKLAKLQSKFMGIPVEDIGPGKAIPLRKYRTTIMDSLSELDVLCMYELLGLSTDMELDEALKDGDMEVAEWTEFRKNNQMMNLVIRSYRDLPINVLFVCHEAWTQDEQKRMHYAPAMTGKLAQQAQGFVDIVGYLKVGKAAEGSEEAGPKRRLYLQPMGRFDAKNRKASFKAVFLDDPFMSDIVGSGESKPAAKPKPKPSK